MEIGEGERREHSETISTTTASPWTRWIEWNTPRWDDDVAIETNERLRPPCTRVNETWG